LRHRVSLCSGAACRSLAVLGHQPISGSRVAASYTFATLALQGATCQDSPRAACLRASAPRAFGAIGPTSIAGHRPQERFGPPAPRAFQALAPTSVSGYATTSISGHRPHESFGPTAPRAFRTIGPTSVLGIARAPSRPPTRTNRFSSSRCPQQHMQVSCRTFIL
jgi:hypothetical protein